MDQNEDPRELELKIEQAERVAARIGDPTTYERLKAWADELRGRLRRRLDARRTRQAISARAHEIWGRTDVQQTVTWSFGFRPRLRSASASAIGFEYLLDVHLISTSANKNPRRYLEQTAGACEQGMERGQPVTEADVARNGLQANSSVMGAARQDEVLSNAQGSCASGTERQSHQRRCVGGRARSPPARARAEFR